jgi:hypothetical protein
MYEKHANKFVYGADTLGRRIRDSPEFRIVARGTFLHLGTFGGMGVYSDALHGVKELMLRED